MAEVDTRKPVSLTHRELEVLRLIAAGYRNADIAQRLSISENTLESHARRLYRKLGVRSRSQAIMHAHALSLLTGASRMKPISVRNDAGSGHATELSQFALRQVIDSLSLTLVYGELLLRHSELPEPVSARLDEMLTEADKLARYLQGIGRDIVARPQAGALVTRPGHRHTRPNCSGDSKRAA